MFSIPIAYLSHDYLTEPKKIINKRYITMVIEIKSILEILIILIGVKLILENWQPPLPISYQAIIMAFFSAVVGLFINFSKEGFITGLIAGTVAFWGRKLFAEIEEIKDSGKDILDDNHRG